MLLAKLHALSTSPETYRTLVNLDNDLHAKNIVRLHTDPLIRLFKIANKQYYTQLAEYILKLCS